MNPKKDGYKDMPTQVQYNQSTKKIKSWGMNPESNQKKNKSSIQENDKY